MRLVLLVLVVVSMPSSAFAQTPKRPNILFILSDDQRFDTIAALGNKHIKTPNLDALVKRGFVFNRAYCMGSRNVAVCVPSRAMIMTGRSLFRVNEQMANQTTWPELFGRARYATFAVGKWHNGADSLKRSFAQASGILLGGMVGSPNNVPLGHFGPNRKLVNEKEDRHIGERITDSAIALIKQQKRDGPFLGYVAYNIPHDPRVAPKKYHDEYSQSPPPPPANFLPVHPFDNGEMTVRDEKLTPWPRTRESVSKELADYYACITFLDHEIGRLVDALKEAGVYEDTIIVFASDHGLAIGSHGLLGKQNLYEHSMRAPLLFAGPGIPHGHSDALVYLLDIFPTLGELAGVTAPPTSEGVSLVSAMRGDSSGMRPTLGAAYRSVQRAIRDDRWHLIVYPQINRKQLFDLRNDPDEITDLSNNPDRAADIERLTAALRTWQETWGDKQPLTTPNPAPDRFQAPK